MMKLAKIVFAFKMTVCSCRVARHAHLTKAPTKTILRPDSHEGISPQLVREARASALILKLLSESNVQNIHTLKERHKSQF